MKTPTYKTHDVLQGTDEWLELRRGKLTASEVKLILTPTLKIANNDKTRTHVYEIAAQRITGYVEPHYQGEDMMRGHEDEIRARDLYSEKYAPVEQVGFVTCDTFGPCIGYSPDGFVGDDGLIEVKSRLAKHQIKTAMSAVMPAEYALQVQTGLLITGREWCDFISYCGGLHMIVIRVLPDVEMQEAIVAAAVLFEEKVQTVMGEYIANVASSQWHPTERVERDLELTV